MFYGLQIQLITYLDAIWENGEAKYLPGGMLYFKSMIRLLNETVKCRREILKSDYEKLKMKGLLWLM